eukprot:CAMPEP_0168318168 /NCGR_PEP_ID=MMETSP0213-20121227/320_1 /TAXON_ID=151035 /ORGANISM="Euplotes harpa, Strain FSP1.4" /LENGTH=195 /DNA_ID=CAMNT_0008319187 /DNA_START=472 /DNA_END=1060 /DNA_ORIENTATION=+
MHQDLHSPLSHREPDLYYTLSNFYSNHRSYLKSKSFSQLRGSSPKPLSDCSPITSNSDASASTSIVNTRLSPSAVAVPCGLIAKHKFNDTFGLREKGVHLGLGTGDVARPVDKGRFRNGDQAQQYLDVQDEQLMNWFQAGVFAEVKRLYGRVEKDLHAGVEYEVVVTRNWAYRMDGRTAVVISDTSQFGDSDEVL